MAPWVFLLFIGVLDFGFYAYAAIATENAARVAALYTSGDPAQAGDSLGACVYALAELNSLPNTRTLMPPCDSLPVVVTATSVTGVDGRAASRVSVTYQTVPMIPIPGLMGQLQITRVAEMRVKR